MKQLALFGDGDLVQIRQYLHVWSETERARRIKTPRDEAQGEGQGNPARETTADNRPASGITRLPSLARTHQGANRDGSPRLVPQPVSPGRQEPASIAKWPES